MNLSIPSRLRLLLPSVALALLVTGCAATSVVPQYVGAPRTGITTAVVTEPLVDNAAWKAYGDTLRKSMVDRLSETPVFREVTTTAADPLPFSAVTVTGHILRAATESKSTILNDNLGAKGTLTGVFQVRDAVGNLLLQFKTTVRSSSPVKMPGRPAINFDSLAKELGVDAANSVMRWMLGRDIRSPAE